MKNKNIKIVNIQHHRNGISGAPFDVVLFDYQKERYISTIFEQKSYISVLKIADMVNGEINSRMRGDFFEDDLRSAVKEWEETC